LHRQFVLDGKDWHAFRVGFAICTQSCQLAAGRSHKTPGRRFGGFRADSRLSMRSCRARAVEATRTAHHRPRDLKVNPPIKEQEQMGLGCGAGFQGNYLVNRSCGNAGEDAQVNVTKRCAGLNLTSLAGVGPATAGCLLVTIIHSHILPPSLPS
jgi:hypothetical protein